MCWKIQSFLMVPFSVLGIEVCLIIGSDEYEVENRNDE